MPTMAAAYPTSTCRPAARTALASTLQRVISRGAILTSINRGTPATYVLVSHIASAIWQCDREHPCWGRKRQGEPNSGSTTRAWACAVAGKRT